MGSLVSNRAHFNMLDSWLNPGGVLRELRVVLMAAGHAEAKTANVLADVVADIATGTNIAVKTLQNVQIVQDDGNGRAYVDADNPQWTNADPDTEIDGGWVWVPETDTRAVGGVNAATNTVTILGEDLTAQFFDGAIFKITGSTDIPDGTYTVQSSSLNGADTDIVTEEDITGSTVDGTITFDDVDLSETYGFGDAVDVDPGGNTIVFILADPMHVLA